MKWIVKNNGNTNNCSFKSNKNTLGDPGDTEGIKLMDSVFSVILYALQSKDIENKILKWGVLRCLPYLELGAFTGNTLSRLNIRLGAGNTEDPIDHIMDCGCFAATIGIDGPKVVESPNMFNGIDGVLKWITTGNNSRSGLALEAAASYLLHYRQSSNASDLNRFDVLEVLPLLNLICCH